MTRTVAITIISLAIGLAGCANTAKRDANPAQVERTDEVGDRSATTTRPSADDILLFGTLASEPAAEADAPVAVTRQARPVAKRKASGGGAQAYNKAGAESYRAGTPRSLPHRARYNPNFNTEAYDHIEENGFRVAKEHPLSTFSIDVDTASYANVRRFLTQSQLPPVDAVRIEEMINYFRYDYPTPTDGRPFAVNVETASAPWDARHRLVRVGVKAKEIDLSDRKPSNLVFLLDVSGSMGRPNKLPLLKKGMKMLVENLGKRDRVAIVVYAGASGLVLPSTPASQKHKILDALDRLQSGGSTNGASGIQLAYQIAQEHFVRGGTNRVILATDGDFNVGVTNQGDLTRLIEKKRKSGVFLSVLGFGMGNYKDSTLENLAKHGDGNYAYVDSLLEARKVLVEEMGGTLVTVAKDVKIQVEFNPAVVQAYRLIGYENRMLKAEDFNNDKKDAGEIGAGHSVTALYEIVPPGETFAAPGIDPLKYQVPTTTATAGKAAAAEGEMLTVKLRYKKPTGGASTKIAFPVTDTGRSIAQASSELRFAAAVAGFGMLLRDSQHKGDFTFADVAELARAGLDRDEGAYRAEFLRLVEIASALPRRSGEPHAAR